MAALCGTCWSRGSAAAVFLLGMLFVAKLPEVNDAARYLGVLTGAIAVTAVVAAVRIWVADCFVGRLLAVTVAVGGLVGLSLNVLSGIPGAPELHRPLGAPGVAVLTLELLVLALTLVDARARAGRSPQNGHYALSS